VMDAFTTVLSLAAQYLLNRKTIENWLLWIVDDVIYIWLYIARDLRLTAVLYFVFLCLCVAGFLSWRRSLNALAGPRDRSRGQSVKRSGSLAKTQCEREDESTSNFLPDCSALDPRSSIFNPLGS
jgi:Nicotinamide mononucleotide transporter